MFLLPVRRSASFFSWANGPAAVQAENWVGGLDGLPKIEWAGQKQGVEKFSLFNIMYIEKTCFFLVV